MRTMYLIGILVIIDQVASTLTAVFPPQPGNAQWRFGVYGIALSHATFVLFADLLILAAAATLEHRMVLRVWGVLHILVAIALSFAVAIFLLDAVQLRSQVQEAARQAILLNSARVGLLSLLLVGFCVWVFVFAWRASRRAPKAGASDILISRPSPSAKP